MQPNYQQMGQQQVPYQPFPYVPPNQFQPQYQYNNIQMQNMSNMTPMPVTPNMSTMQNLSNMQNAGIYQQQIMIQAKSGLQKLGECQGIFIKQKFEALEVISGCETPNVYKVFPADVNGTKTSDNTIFKCKEKSNWCQRNCLPADCRPFNMKVSNEEGTIKNGQFDDTLFLQLERPFKCTCLCFARPQMSVSVVENGMNKFLGKIKNPCLFCSLGCNIEDSAGNLKYMITGSCCQIGFLCSGFPCKSCQEFFFEVRSPSGDLVSRLQKQSAGCFKSCVGDADNFALGFPQAAQPEDKALLMAAALFLDYMYFESKQNPAPQLLNN